jgi:hypothetical protein
MRELGLCFLTVASLLGAPACILDTTNDDDGAETGNGTGNVTSSDGSESGSTAAAETSGTAAETAEASTAADDTAGAGVCGWGPTGDEVVPEGHLLCPEAVDLQVGGGCGGITGQGCCDAQGNAWFCGNDGSGEALARLEC